MSVEIELIVPVTTEDGEPIPEGDVGDGAEDKALEKLDHVLEEAGCTVSVMTMVDTDLMAVRGQTPAGETITIDKGGLHTHD